MSTPREWAGCAERLVGRPRSAWAGCAERLAGGHPRAAWPGLCPTCARARGGGRGGRARAW
eukprot:2829206-Pyramimonas_sp.AAC.1